MLRILLVEDCPDTAASMTLLLGMWGHDVRAARDGPEALAAAAEYRPHVVFLDVGLPGMDGFTVARRLRALPESAGAYLVTLSGYGQEADRQQSAAAGCDEHRVKPADVDALRLLLDRLQAERFGGAGGGPCPDGEGPATEARARLHDRGYLALRGVRCEWSDGVLTLRGRLPTRHLKQLALAAVASLDGVRGVRNEIEVGVGADG